ncbi:conserved exported hypothetical protein [Treponema phagedenis]|uniref:Uncharacterized protein n=1 Tax=Treponema phagedenis TaxID=162 RepID=A0A0B7H2B5_TREPH|nr:conserved exported hypothetical protein [Treponema phagedenis]
MQGYLKKAVQGKYTEALALIKKENPFFRQYAAMFVTAAARMPAHAAALTKQLPLMK